MKTIQATTFVVRIFFLRSVRGGSLLDRLLAKSISDYQKSFGYTSNVAHIVLQVGDVCYETTLDGTVAYPFTDDMFNLPRVLCYWELDLRFLELSEEKKKAVDFFLSRFASRKLDILGCLKYLAEHKFCNLLGFDTEAEDLSLLPKASVKDNKLQFSLPYTCCTLANEVLYRCIDLPLASDSHLPSTLMLTTIGLADTGIGELFFNGLPPIIEFT